MIESASTGTVATALNVTSIQPRLSSGGAVEDLRVRRVGELRGGERDVEVLGLGLVQLTARVAEAAGDEGDEVAAGREGRRQAVAVGVERPTRMSVEPRATVVPAASVSCSSSPLIVVCSSVLPLGGRKVTSR